MQVRIQNSYQLVLTKPYPRQREHKMHLNMCSPTPPMPARTYNTSLTCGEKPPIPMPARTQDASHVLTLVIQCQPGHKMFSAYVHQTYPMPANTQNALNIC